MTLAKAPFNASGNLMHYALPDNRTSSVFGLDRPHEWRDNKPFMSTMKLEGLRRGRSAAYFMWEDLGGAQYPMFMKEMTDLLQTRIVRYGCVYGQWIVVKRGTNYGIRMVGE